MTDRHRTEPLSRAGLARRDAILAVTIAALDARRRRRRAVRGGLLALAFLVIGVAAGRAAQLWRGPGTPGPEPPVVRGPQDLPGAPAHVAARPRIIVVTDNRRTGRIRAVGDDELLTFLDQIDRPAGLVREGGSVRLTGAVNDELALP